MKKFLLINFTAVDTNSNEAPYLWLTLKSYFQRNSSDPTQWQWLDPVHSSEANSEEDIINSVVEQNPDVIGISCYMWNDKLTFHIIEEVKKRLPSVKIIAGGPALYYERDMAWFSKYWYIDIVCEYNGYGEIFITDYLDGKEPEDIPFAIYPSQSRNFWYKSKAEFAKRTFKYPMPYSDNKEYLQRFTKDKVKITLDTSRGCPYSCSFCEWGGGTNSKVVFKPLEDVYTELETVFSILQPAYIDIINANFGITKDDIEITKKMVELNYITNSVKCVNLYGPTKTSKKNLKQIFDLLLGAKMLDDIKMSIQHTDQTILDNINRVDTSFDEQLDLFGDLCYKYEYPLRVETMMGLPGETLDTYYQLTDNMTKSPLLEPMMHEWMMLPSAPAANPEYVSKMKLKTRKIRYHIDSYDRHILPRNRYSLKVEQSGYRELLLDHKWVEPYDAVVSTYSYTMEDWVEMELFKYYFTFLNTTRITTPITRYLRTKGHSVAEFNRKLFKEFLMNIDVVKKSYDKMVADMHGEQPVDIFYADLSDNLPYISHYSVLKFFILLNPEAFFKSLEQFLRKNFGEDEVFGIICQHLCDNIKTPIRDNKPPKQCVSEILSMCRYWGDNLFLDDFVAKY